MKKTSLTILAAGTLLLISGCNQQASNAAETDPAASVGGVAIIDLDATAKALGRDKVMAANLRQHTTRTQEKLRVLQENLQTQIKGQQEQVANSENPEDAETISVMTRKANLRWRQALGAEQKNATKMRTDLVNDFLQEVQPAARRAAVDRGLSVVMLRRPNLLYVDPAVDITDDVIDDMQVQAAAATPAPSKNPSTPVDNTP